MTTTNGTAISVFISYAHEDEALLEQLHTHLSSLTRPGSIVTWYDRRIVAGSDWAGEIDAHLEQASIILLLVSADFIASKYCYEIEMTRALERHDAGQARVLPIIVRPVDWKNMPFARLQALPTDAKPVMSWNNQDDAWVNIIAGIRRAIEDLSQLPASTAHQALPPVWNIPYPRNTFFLGRDELLERLHTQLQAGQTTAISQPPPTGQALAQSPQAISGLGGIGKTQLAIEYAYRYSHDYEAVLWARAETREDLIASYSALATLLNLPERTAGDQEITIAAVKRWLQTHQKWLLILDNADDLDLLPPFLPPVPGGHILLTTRAYDMQRLARRLEVETLPIEQGALLLLRRAALLPPDGELAHAPADEQRLARALTEELGGLPLALDQAGAYLEATGMSLGEYLHIYQTHRQTLLNERRSLIEDHPAPVATTWSLSFEHVEEKNPAAADLLRLCAFLAPDAIPESIIRAPAQKLPRSFVGSLLGWLSGRKEKASAQSALSFVVTDPHLFNQAIEALRAYSLLTRDPRTKTLSVHRLVQAVTQDSLPAEAAQQWKQRALEIYEQQLGAQHPNTATSLNNLARLYDAQGKDELAEPLLRRALAILEQALGDEHPNTQTVRGNYAALLRAMGREEEARRMEEEL